jgi:hypothetical protein
MASLLITLVSLGVVALAALFGDQEGSSSSLAEFELEGTQNAQQQQITKLKKRTSEGACLSKRELQYLCPTNPVPNGYDPSGRTKGILFVYEDDYHAGFFAMITDVLNQVTEHEREHSLSPTDSPYSLTSTVDSRRVGVQRCGSSCGAAGKQEVCNDEGL